MRIRQAQDSMHNPCSASYRQGWSVADIHGASWLLRCSFARKIFDAQKHGDREVSASLTPKRRKQLASVYSLCGTCRIGNETEIHPVCKLSQQHS